MHNKFRVPVLEKPKNINTGRGHDTLPEVTNMAAAMKKGDMVRVYFNFKSRF